MAESRDNPEDPSLSSASNSNSAQSSSSTAPPQLQCASCTKSPSSLKECIKCHSVSYCNKDCQKSHFKMHKKVCAGLAQEYSKNNEPKMARSTVSTKVARDRGLQKWQFDT